MVDLAIMDEKSLGKLFDYAILPKDTTQQKVLDGAVEAQKWNCAAMYVSSPYWMPVLVDALADSDVLPALGSSTPAVKEMEALEAVCFGAKSIDMCLNLGALNDGDLNVVRDELKRFKGAAGDAVITKGILDMAFLTDDEIKRACDLLIECQIDYMKTATGQFEGPSMEQFLVARKACEGSDVKLKVSGVKFPRPQNAYAFIMAGADLIGTRAAPEIISALSTMREIGIAPKYAE
ncbi:2-deoxyribose-5-phosphate aldolase [Eubacterium aggregans]|uniref:2-deoxyribose-5-phosphate aldolase n=1 Tax=Eubacterium aggregans TaxID=81409 RepID=UPI003F39E5AA